ncbi:hypothetical protein Verru16b_03552 [Lacunisphaera limnophila]|uniref:STAS/SEC14 domain-containing protein n=2 Tax=Lacunisphaera limnophila TaxID=1838286 RepID=A0A1D8AZX5_9BACT|nr:hypothetical protein Verru16b_03552 [Lacunisphaera limnophila]
MPIRIQLLPEYVHVVWHGELVNQDLEFLSAEMPRIGRQIGRAPNVLHTFEEVTSTSLRFDAMHIHGNRLRSVKVPNSCRIASVCHQPVAFGMARMMQLINQNPALQMQVFTELEPALRWLKDAPATPEKAPAAGQVPA